MEGQAGARRGRFGREAVATAAALAFAIGGGIATNVLIARALGPSGRGAFELGRTIASIVGSAAGLGVGAATVFLRPRRELSVGEGFGAVCGSLATGTVAGAILGAVLTTGALPLSRLHAVLVAAAIPLIAFYYQGQAALQGFGSGTWFRRTLALRDWLFVVLIAVALAWRQTLTMLLVAWDVQWLLGAGVIAVLLARRCGRPRRPRLRLRRLVAIGTSQLLLTLLVRAHVRLDVIVLAAVRGRHSLGEYAVAVGAVQPITAAGAALSVALYPRSAVSSARAAGGGAVRTARSVRTLLGVTVAGALALLVVGPRLVTLLFGERFAPAGTPLRVLLPGAVTMAVFVALQGDLAGRGRRRVVAVSSFAATSANLVLNIFLIPRLGATGAALSSSVTYTLAAALLLRAFTRETGVPVRSCLVPRLRDARDAAAVLTRSKPVVE